MSEADKEDNSKKTEAVGVVAPGYTVYDGRETYNPGSKVKLPVSEIKRLKKAGVITNGR